MPYPCITANNVSPNNIVTSLTFPQIGAFNVWPTTLDLKPRCRSSLKVAFEPDDIGVYREAFVLVCDNCQVKHFTLAGVGSKMDMPQLVMLDDEEPSDEALTKPLWFGEQVSLYYNTIN